MLFAKRSCTSGSCHPSGPADPSRVLSPAPVVTVVVAPKPAVRCSIACFQL